MRISFFGAYFLAQSSLVIDMAKGGCMLWEGGWGEKGNQRTLKFESLKTVDKNTFETVYLVPHTQSCYHLTIVQHGLGQLVHKQGVPNQCCISLPKYDQARKYHSPRQAQAPWNVLKWAWVQPAKIYDSNLTAKTFVFFLNVPLLKNDLWDKLNKLWPSTRYTYSILQPSSNGKGCHRYLRIDQIHQSQFLNLCSTEQKDCSCNLSY